MTYQQASPIPMILHCPMCHARHIDEGEFATRPHHTHSCQTCGHCFRPALINTIGVQFLPGFKNTVEDVPVLTEQDVRDALAPRYCRCPDPKPNVRIRVCVSCGLSRNNTGRIVTADVLRKHIEAEDRKPQCDAVRDEEYLYMRCIAKKGHPGNHVCKVGEWKQWIDEPLYVKGGPNPRVPLFDEELSIRVANGLQRLAQAFGSRSPLTTRWLVSWTHDDAQRRAQWGKKSLGDMTKVLRKLGVQWPVGGAK